MPVFEYKGLDGGGKAVAGIVDADTAKVARTRLRKQGLFPTEIHEQAGGARRGESVLDMQIDVAKYFQFVSSRDVSVMTTQLSTLVSAHVPMAEALAALVDQTEKEKLKVVLSKVKERVNEGSTLADSMADHPTSSTTCTCRWCAPERSRERSTRYWRGSRPMPTRRSSCRGRSCRPSPIRRCSA